MNDESIFSRALELESSSEKERFLDLACGENPDQRQRIQQLLAEHANPDSFLNRGARPEAVATTAAGEQSPDPADRDRIGDYRLLHVLGEGGMGTVYLAEQQQPVRRRVAVKIIKQGMNTKQFIARFEAERPALAMMDHPNIAKVLGAGCTEDGRPYFVMELVKGIQITEFCDQNRLSTTDRLELFVQVCQAVQHAHQKGIIHRDLKPSNVLVAMYDNQPVPKVIDFGVAKATHQPLTEHTLCTIPGQIVGTWEYMSPEQAILNQLDVDTRTDVYSLGVILYELLTGKTPLDLGSLKPEALEERLRRIREQEPSRPSLRVSSLGQAGAAMETYRSAEEAELARSLKGDLDWIVMKALEKDRTKRYETASGFAAEIGRYLNDEPLSFRPPSSLQQLGRFCRRNKSIAATLASIAAALVVGTTLALWGYFSAVSARDEVASVNVELEGKNTELEDALNQLRQVNLDRISAEIFDSLLRADFEEADQLLSEGKSLEASEDWLHFSEGQISLFESEYGDAKQSLERVRQGPNRIAAQGLLAVAHMWSGDEFSYFQQLRAIEDAPISGFKELLCMGYAHCWGRPERAVQLLTEAAIIEKNHSFLRIVRAQALRLRAMDLIDAEEAKPLIDRALSDIESQKDMVNNVPLVATETTLGHLAASNIYKKLGMAVEVERHETAARRMELTLLKLEDSPKVPYVLVLLLSHFDPHEVLQLHSRWINSEVKIEPHACNWMGFNLLECGEYEKSLEWLQRRGTGPTGRDWKFVDRYVEFVNPNRTVSRNELKRQSEKDLIQNVEGPIVVFHVNQIELFAGDDSFRGFIRGATNRNAISEFNLKFFDFFGDPPTSRQMSADQFLRQCTKSNRPVFNRMHANFFLGIEALARGEVELATSRFEACRDDNGFQFGVYRLSQAFLAHKDQWNSCLDW